MIQQNINKRYPHLSPEQNRVLVQEITLQRSGKVNLLPPKSQTIELKPEQYHTGKNPLHKVNDVMSNKSGVKSINANRPG